MLAGRMRKTNLTLWEVVKPTRGSPGNVLIKKGIKLNRGKQLCDIAERSRITFSTKISDECTHDSETFAG